MIELDYRNATPEDRAFIEDLLLLKRMKGNFHRKGTLLYEMGANRKYWTRRLQGVQLYFYNKDLENTTIAVRSINDWSKTYIRIEIPRNVITKYN
jgi:hypothetical protein